MKSKRNHPLPCFETYDEATGFLFSQLPMYQQVGSIAYKADLKTPMQLDKYFGKPHKKFRSIHIAGTNGKGSVSHLLAAVLQAAGYSVGLYTSPHLKDFRERIRVDGHPIFESEVLDFVNNHRPFIEEATPSFFEMTTAMAFDYFARREVDLAVVETGMGGRLDATNIITPEVSIITNIGLDHMEHLGNTLALVAQEKAGIIKPRVPVVLGSVVPETQAVFAAAAAKQKAPWWIAKDYTLVTPEYTLGNRQFFIARYTHTPVANFRVGIDLLGDYQQENLATVLTAIDVLRTAIKKPLYLRFDSVEKGLANAAKTTGLRGRWELIGNDPTVICDTGHNAHGLQHTFSQLQNTPHKQLYIVLGVVADKDISSLLPLLPRDAFYFFTQADLPRALNAELLAAQCTDAGLQGEVVPRVKEALAAARNKATKDDVIFVGGSNFVVAEVI